MRLGVLIVATFLSLLTSCQENENASSPNTATVEVESPSIPAQPIVDAPNYVEEERGVYFYIAAVSEDDQKKGKVAGDVIGFRYLGKDAKGQHVLGLVDDSGRVISKATCAEPCVVIRHGDGSRVAYDPASIIGSAFEDVINGHLKPANVGPVSSSDSTDSPLTLGSIKDTDWQKIGMGCSCSFSVGTPRKEKLIAGGDGLTFFRLNGQDHLCPAPDTQAMFDGPVSMSCGSAAVQVTPFGKVQPGGDGHSSNARLHIADTSGTLSLTGTWGCGC